MARVNVVGSINMDVVAYLARLPVAGETVFGREVRYFPGGKGANQAVAARRAGAETRLVGRLGRDDFGARMRAFLEAERLDLRHVTTIDGAGTGTALINVDDTGQNAIVVVPGANHAWEPGFETALRFEPGDVVIAQHEVPESIIVGAFLAARAAGAATLLNPAPMRPIADELLALTDHLVLNEVELEQAVARALSVRDLAGIEAAARSLLTEGLTSVVVTLGRQGALGLTVEHRIRLEGHQVTAVDTTGAGDCFVGVLAAGLAEGHGLAAALASANRAASLSVMRAGAAVSMPTRAEIEAAGRFMPG